MVDACCLPVNSTGIGSAKASLTFGNCPRDLDRRFNLDLVRREILTVCPVTVPEFLKDNFVICSYE